MKKPFLIIAVSVLIISCSVFYLYKSTKPGLRNNINSIGLPTQSVPQNPLSISAMRQKEYPGSEITIEETLPDGENYHQYLTSYKSEGLKIYALLTVPMGQKPVSGWPVILFNHGYISPKTYQTFPSVGQYATYLPVFARNGYIVFKPDYRGNGNSEGTPQGAYYSPSYTIDDLNALSAIKNYKSPSAGSGQVANPNKIGVWGHSMGGNITLRDLVVGPKDIKVAVIWGGVVGSYNDLLFHWHDPAYHPTSEEQALRNRYRTNLLQKYGTPESNPSFWNSIDPTYFINDITAPVQLDVGGADPEVPPNFSMTLRDKLQKAGKTVEYYEYPDADHNISQSFNEAMQNSLNFFNKYLK